MKKKMEKSKEVSDKEYDCPICMSILIEPVTMPCNHSLCMPCYRQTVEKANLCCPICRGRISVWARTAAKKNTLVDSKKWSYIQKNFADKVNHRLAGSAQSDSDSEEEDLEIYLRRLKELSEPGEIRQEYEAALEKLRLQKEEEARKEEEASRALIEALQAEEFSVLERSSLEMEEIEKTDRQKALEIDQEQQLQSHKLKVNLQSPAGKKSLKIGSTNRAQQNKVFPPPVTLNRFYAAVPRQAQSPLPLSNDKCGSQEKRKEKSFLAGLSPGLSHFCWPQTDENCEGRHAFKSEVKRELGNNDVIPGPSGLAMVKRNHLTESFKANVDFNCASYQPVVKCENNIRLNKIFHFESRAKCVKLATDCSIKSLVCDKVLENVMDERVVSTGNSAADSLDNHEKATLRTPICSAGSLADTGLVRDSNSTSVNCSSEAVTYAPHRLTESSEAPQEELCSPSTTADGRLEGETLPDIFVNGILAKHKDPSVDLCILDKFSGNGQQDLSSILDCEQQVPPKTKGKTKSSGPHRQKGKNSFAHLRDKRSAEPSRGKSLLPTDTLDGFVTSVKRAGGDLEEPCGKRQKQSQPSGLDVAQEEADRLYALKLQEMYQFLDKKNMAVERFEGSVGEYSLRKKHTS